MKNAAFLLIALFVFATSPAQSNRAGDSLAVIKRFMTASGSEGLQYRYIDTYSFKRGKKDTTETDTMSVVMCDNHNIRTNLGTVGMQVIGNGDLPGYSLILNPQIKTYAVHIIDTVRDRGTYTVVKVGNEVVQGYHCVHARLTISYGKGTDVTEDLWLSTDVQGYEAFKKLATMQRVTPKMLAALDQAGCPGMFVKMQTQSTQFSMSMLLVGVDRKSFPGSMFQIPSDYTQAAVRRH
jgi:hypothetical protein